jgi:hypothetical protein
LIGRRALAAACALAAALAARAQDAAPAPSLDDVARAVDAARADARRDFASDAAAVAAYARLGRLREPLLSAADPRRAIWQADAAEDALTLGLGADGCGVASIVGLADDAQRARAADLLREALARVRDADAAAREALADGSADPELVRRLDDVELVRRIPLVRACAATLAAWAGALPEADAPGIVASATARLEALRASVPPAARPLAETCLGLALARGERRAEAPAVLQPIVADARTAQGLRLLAIAGLAEALAPDAAGRRRALAPMRTRAAPSLDDPGRLLLGDLDFRLARAASLDATADARAAAPAWSGWLDAVSAASPAARETVRAAALARIARNADGLDDAVARAARALARSRDPATRADGVEALRAAIADGSLDERVRPAAMLGLGRALLLLGRPSEGAQALLDYARACPAEPSSRHAIDAAVAAARGTGDPALLSEVLATAVGRFPDHPDHGAWRVELAAVSLSPDAPPAAREPAPARAARALDALDRSDRGAMPDPAVRADLAVAAADALSEQGAPDRAIAALDRVPADPSLPEGLRERLLEERIRALALSGRGIDADARVADAVRADGAGTADCAARVLRRMSAVDLGTLASERRDERWAAEVGRLASAVGRMAPPTADRDEVLARALVAAGLHSDALPVARRAIAERGERADLLLALAEALWGIGAPDGLAEAMAAYDRVARSVPERSASWWLCQLRRLQVLDRAGRSREAIAPRIARLRAVDPGLGGPELAAQFLALAARDG